MMLKYVFQSMISAGRHNHAHMSIISLNLKIPLPLSMPSTPSGIRYERAAEPLGTLSSEVSVTRTSPATFTDSMREGTMFYDRLLARPLADSKTAACVMEDYKLTNRRELQTSPMKLLLCAICTASFTDIELCPLLGITAPESFAPGLAASRLAPRSLHNKTGSGDLLAVRSCSRPWDTDN